MAEIIRLPRMSDTMEEGVIVGWEKKVGDSVEPGDLLAEIETDKATMDFESMHEGVLLHIEVESGAVPINGLIAIIGEEGEDFKDALEAARNENGSTSEGQEATADSSQADDAGSSSAEAAKTSSEEITDINTADSRVKASPLAKSMANEAGISLAQVQGTGDQGRIVKKDIEAFLAQQQEAPKAQPAPTPESAPVPQVKPAAPSAPAKDAGPSIPAFSFSGGDESFEDLTVSQMRKTIARRLGESKFSAPHFYLTVEINMDKSIELRKSINGLIAPAKVSFNDIVIKAVAMALRHHPAVNSSWMGDKIRRHHNIHVGVAVAVEEGLLVPVIRFSDMKTFMQINTEVKDLATRAKNKKLSLDEMQGNTFTISNLGMFGIEEFTAIINPPDSCILAVGGIIQKPIIKNGEVSVGNMMKVTLSCDHRVVDGATGAKFLQTLKEMLEEPVRLMV